jgi:phosphomethylpyrimidine synthase
VDYFTIHAGCAAAHLPFVKDRLIGIVSRGGSLLAKWMLTTTREPDVRPSGTTSARSCASTTSRFSIGDGLRPGGLADATDQAQLAELADDRRADRTRLAHGVQVMVEGPGPRAVRSDRVQHEAPAPLCHGAPFYVLGPLVTDVFPGYDHITSCIGATSIAYHGAEHALLRHAQGAPRPAQAGDVKQGCIAYKIAAHAADVALGIPGTRDWDDELTKARAALNWEKHFELAYDPDTPAPTTTRTSTSTPTSAPCAATTGAACGSARRSRSSPRARRRLRAQARKAVVKSDASDARAAEDPRSNAASPAPTRNAACGRGRRARARGCRRRRSARGRGARAESSRCPRRPPWLRSAFPGSCRRAASP